MITDIQCSSEIGPDLDHGKLNPYWNEYFDFVRYAPELHALSDVALTSALDDARAQSRPFLDAQQAISEILTRFGIQHNFHRKFNERFDFKPSQILGMQLYEIVTRDADWWVYLPTRGKFIIEIYKLILDNLKADSRKDAPIIFGEKRKSSLVWSNQILAELSSFAETPSSLSRFLRAAFP